MVITKLSLKGVVIEEFCTRAEGNTLPNRNYEAKNILYPMGMEFKNIHACPKDCILYRKDF